MNRSISDPNITSWILNGSNASSVSIFLGPNLYTATGPDPPNLFSSDDALNYPKMLKASKDIYNIAFNKLSEKFMYFKPYSITST